MRRPRLRTAATRGGTRRRGVGEPRRKDRALVALQHFEPRCDIPGMIVGNCRHKFQFGYEFLAGTPLVTPSNPVPLAFEFGQAYRYPIPRILRILSVPSG